MWLSLIGFMGSGKSTVAALLAERVVVKAVDLDALVVERTGTSIGDIFHNRGEEAFRDAEAEVLWSLSPAEDSVVACGGGIIERQRNRMLLRERGVVIWLDLPWAAQRTRLESMDVTGRPLLSGRSWHDIEQLYRRRRSLYARTAHFRLRSDLASPDVLAHQALVRRLAWTQRRKDADA